MARGRVERWCGQRPCLKFDMPAHEDYARRERGLCHDLTPKGKTMEQTAKTLYGSAYTQDRANFLDKAFRFLSMALRAENTTKESMAFNAAVKAESEAFTLYP